MFAMVVTVIVGTGVGRLDVGWAEFLVLAVAFAADGSAQQAGDSQ